MGYSPWGRKESDTTGQLPFHFGPTCSLEASAPPLKKTFVYFCLHWVFIAACGPSRVVAGGVLTAVASPVAGRRL